MGQEVKKDWIFGILEVFLDFFGIFGILEAFFVFGEKAVKTRGIQKNPKKHREFQKSNIFLPLEPLESPGAS